VQPEPRGSNSPSINPLIYKAGIPVVLALGIYLLPVPVGVNPLGLHMLGIFVGTVVALILQPLPTG
jgi:DASS family divalent anion:Na+ symporter